MADTTTPFGPRPVRWAFPPNDGFFGLQEHQRLQMIHALPGILVWPILLFGLAITFQFLSGGAWALIDGKTLGISLETTQFAGSTVAYGVLAMLMWHHFGIYAAHRAAFSVIPKRWSELVIGLLILGAMLMVGSPLTVWFHQFAMVDPNLTLAGGADLKDVSNVDNFVQSGAALWSIVLLTLVAAPIVEEILFRGWMLPMLVARGVPGLFAVLISGLAFGLIHTGQGLMVMTSTALLGFALGAARLATGRVAASVLGHMANNAWAIFAVPFLTGMQSG
ncbi:type II CAAX endopeptidase family protein [uncultured Maricaulis sp.]|uniref:CPBP family intramembrane glutamic endopeptidase n=1 Tax=uncultured Maricaulis sp. TaxID=174710 RepID=UPI0030D8DA2A|tara:strand:+ start:60628 stop:61461 length:834 start_codon:yes stop_codon:yes gene_type:complete